MDRRFWPHSLFVFLAAPAFALGWPQELRAQSAAPATAEAKTRPSNTSTDSTDDRLAVEKLLPPSVAETVDVNVWGWLGYLHTSDSDHANYWLADLAAGGTKRFGDSLAVSANMHFIDDNNHTSGFLEQAFATAVVLPQHQTLLSVGKFNAGFGAEARNEWDRLSGTSSILFGAQPQDLIGVIGTQPIGDTGITLRPFLVNGFEGRFNFDQAPSGGITANYHRDDALNVGVTNWIGPGAVPEDDVGEYDGTDYVVDNWRGTRLKSEREGVLYFLESQVQWLPRPDLTLAGEGLLAVTDRADKYAWGGVMLLANFDITDRLRVFGSWSFLDDAQGIVTGLVDRRHEVSAGAGYQIIYGLDLRGEYRHDFALTGDLDTFSVHITFAY